MTVRSWLELLVVPLALVVIGFLFSVQQDARQQRIENQRAEAERELAVQRAQDEALQAYLNQMSSLLLERGLRNSEVDSEVRTLARARTLTVLSRFDTSGKTAVMQFLEEAALVQGAGLFQGAGRGPIIDLDDADLSGADLSGANLSRAEGITNEELDQQAASLEGATMPNGQKYEEWLKDKKAQGKDGKNEGSS